MPVLRRKGRLNELALFAGAGGGLLASQSIGWRTVCAVEISEYCRCILNQRQNERHLRHSFPIWDDIRTFDGRPWRKRIDVVSGGFPCQAYSTAAAGKNNADDLWPEMRRVVADVSPRYVFAENVERRAINRAADDLESMGYKTKAVSLSAKDLGGDHLRERHWLLAYTDDPRELLRGLNAETFILQGMENGFWQGSPEISGMDDGLAYRVDRLKATGNGQVPFVAIAALYVLTNE